MDLMKQLGEKVKSVLRQRTGVLVVGAPYGKSCSGLIFKMHVVSLNVQDREATLADP